MFYAFHLYQLIKLNFTCSCMPCLSNTKMVLFSLQYVENTILCFDLKDDKLLEAVNSDYKYGFCFLLLFFSPHKNISPPYPCKLCGARI